MKITQFLDNESNYDKSLTKEDYNFFGKVISKVTQTEKLPLNISSVDVISAIKNNIEWYYEYCPWATVSDNVIFDLSKLPKAEQAFINDHPELAIANDVILMPDVIQGVFDVQWFEGRASFGDINHHIWRLDSMLSSSIGSAHGTLQGIDTYFANIMIANTFESVSKIPVAYDYDANSKELRIYDSNARKGKIQMTVDRRVKLATLYRDTWFLNFISAQVIVAAVEHLQMFDAKLPGDLNLNISNVETRGREMLDEVREYLEIETELDLHIIKN